MLRKLFVSAVLVSGATLAFGDTAGANAYQTPAVVDTADDPNIGTPGVIGDLTGGNYWTVDLLQNITNKWGQTKALAQIDGSAGTFWDHPDRDDEVPQPTLAAAGHKSLVYDTFYTLPVLQPAKQNLTGFGAPSFTGAGNTVNKDFIRGEDNTMDGVADQGRTWFQTGSPTGPGNNFIVARYTICLTDPEDCLATSPNGPDGLPGTADDTPAVLGTIAGIVGGVGVGITDYSITLYHKPEPATLALVAIGGLASLIRRR